MWIIKDPDSGFYFNEVTRDFREDQKCATRYSTYREAVVRYFNSSLSTYRIVKLKIRPRCEKCGK